MSDIAAARKGFKDKVISNIGFVLSSRNIAEDLTKPMSQAIASRDIAYRNHPSISRGMDFEELIQLTFHLYFSSQDSLTLIEV